MSHALALARAVYVATGSSIERLIRCASSIALPHVYFETIHSERGVVIHSFLEATTKVGREDALAAVPDQWRDACDALDLTGLDAQLALTAEIAMAYDCERDVTRELGRGAGRIYDDVQETEIPCMLDIVGVREVVVEEIETSPGVFFQVKKRIGLVVDWKSGWLTRRKNVSTDWQLKFGALAAARRFDLDEVEVQLINVAEGMKPYARRAYYTSFDIARIASEVRDFYAGAVEVRALYRTGRLPERFNVGEWCEHCPSKLLCPSQRARITAALALEPSDIRQLPPAQLGELYVKGKEAIGLLAKMCDEIEGLVGAPGLPSLFLSNEADGKSRWLAMVMSDPNEYLDGPISFDVVRRMLGEKYALIAAPPKASKKGITKAIQQAQKDRVVRPKKGTEKRNEILVEIRKAKGTRRATPAPVVQEMIVEKPLPGGALPALPEGDADE